MGVFHILPCELEQGLEERDLLVAQDSGVQKSSCLFIRTLFLFTRTFTLRIIQTPLGGVFLAPNREKASHFPVVNVKESNLFSYCFCPEFKAKEATQLYWGFTPRVSTVSHDSPILGASRSIIGYSDMQPEAELLLLHLLLLLCMIRTWLLGQWPLGPGPVPAHIAASCTGPRAVGAQTLIGFLSPRMVSWASLLGCLSQRVLPWGPISCRSVSSPCPRQVSHFEWP